MNIRNIVIGIIIAVVFVMFAAYGTNLIYESPKYENYCNNTIFPQAKPGFSCNFSESLSQKVNACYNSGGTPIYSYDNNGCEQDITCSTCSQDFQKAEEDYSKTLFIISIVVSLIVIAIAAFLISVASVSGGLMFGALMYLIYGTARYWGYMDDWMRFIILGVALVILIYIGYRLARKEKR